MITEDYVGFEMAKLLKEKGFDWDCKQVYDLVRPQSCADGKMYDNFSDKNPNANSELVSAPTLQMAMKWLRNKHDIVCSVGLFTDLPGTPPYWSFNILNQSTADTMYEAFDVKCETYEEACEAAIKYCLENLI